MKRIEYQILTEINLGTQEEPNLVQTAHTCTIACPDHLFQANYAIAEKEAHGEITVEDVPEETSPPTPEEDTAAMLVDHEYRLTLLELGLTE